MLSPAHCPQGGAGQAEGRASGCVAPRECRQIRGSDGFHSNDQGALSEHHCLLAKLQSGKRKP